MEDSGDPIDISAGTKGLRQHGYQRSGYMELQRSAYSLVCRKDVQQRSPEGSKEMLVMASRHGGYNDTNPYHKTYLLGTKGFIRQGKPRSIEMLNGPRTKGSFTSLQLWHVDSCWYSNGRV